MANIHHFFSPQLILNFTHSWPLLWLVKTAFQVDWFRSSFPRVMSPCLSYHRPSMIVAIAQIQLLQGRKEAREISFNFPGLRCISCSLWLLMVTGCYPLNTAINFFWSVCFIWYLEGGGVKIGQVVVTILISMEHLLCYLKEVFCHWE